MLRALGGEGFYAETKYDGDRVQLHKHGSTFRYLTRSPKDYTDRFGGDGAAGTHCPHIHRAFDRHACSSHAALSRSRGVRNCILDGEMVGWDLAAGVFMPKGDNIDVKSLGVRNAEGHIDVCRRAQAHVASPAQYSPCFVVFDIVYLNDQNLCQQPLADRLELLKTVFTPVPGYLTHAYRAVRAVTVHACLMPAQFGRTKDDFLVEANRAIDHREEGLILKRPSSTYKPGACRRRASPVTPAQTAARASLCALAPRAALTVAAAGSSGSPSTPTAWPTTWTC